MLRRSLGVLVVAFMAQDGGCLVQATVATSLKDGDATYTTATSDSSNSHIPQEQRQLQKNNNEDCNYEKDTCFQGWQVDGQCDSGNNAYGCWGQDCWDCDSCSEHDYTSCEECTRTSTTNGGNNNCVWCPGDGTCKRQAVGESFWQLHTDKLPSCLQESDWIVDSESCTSGEGTPFSDPLVDAMDWSYQLINVYPVWQQGITGKGVHVRLNDVGMDADHAEFQGNNKFDWEASCPNFESDPDPEGTSRHGTGVASLLAADGNNEECAVGIAPGVTLSGCNFASDFIEEELAVMMATKFEQVDISNNAWGPEICLNLNFVRQRRRQRYHKKRMLQESSNNNNNSQQHRQLQEECIFDPNHPDSPCEVCNNIDMENLDDGNLSQSCEDAIDSYCTYRFDHDQEACAEFLNLFTSCEYHSLSQDVQLVLEQGASEGRQGKGIIYVFASGNSHDLGGFTNSDGFINSRFTIPVGAVGKDGKHASYSTTGSALFITAPGGDFEFVSNNMVAKPGGGCHEITGGTSFACPIVSGVIALMLEVNPDLGWRDVQHILAETAQKSDPDNDDWTINGAGLNVSYKYGFGIVDAAAAVEAGRSWTNVGPEREIVAQSPTINLVIPDDSSMSVAHSQIIETSTTALTRNTTSSFVVESVAVYLDLTHASRGDLLITLTSPAGTESILSPSGRPENQQLASNETWLLTSVRHWNENPHGAWELEITDENRGIRATCADEPFEHVYQDVSGEWAVYRCLNAGRMYHCRDGEVLREEAIAENTDRGRDGLTAATACCVCGGGVDVSNGNNMLRSWSLVIYGYEKGGDDEIILPGELETVTDGALVSNATNQSSAIQNNSAVSLGFMNVANSSSNVVDTAMVVEDDTTASNTKTNPSSEGNAESPSPDAVVGDEGAPKDASNAENVEDDALASSRAFSAGEDFGLLALATLLVAVFAWS